MNATRFGHVDHSQALKYLTLKIEVKTYGDILKICEILHNL